MEFLMGNEAIARGAMDAGVQVVAGYPGTPSTEILEAVARWNDGSIYVEWSVNEKAALEVAAGASYAGARTLVTMKQVGLNVAADPLMSLAYVGVKGGMVLAVADDPGPISSQTEQDTRLFARFAKVPVFDPSSPEEAYAMMADAYALSEQYRTPVIIRPTTRICHGCATVDTKERQPQIQPEGFIKDAQRWVIFPKASYINHQNIEIRNPRIGREFAEASPFNRLVKGGRKGVACGGVSYAYVMEALKALPGHNLTLLKIGTPHPFPEPLAEDFLRGVDEVLVMEELDPVIERELQLLCGQKHLSADIRGKQDGTVPFAGEHSVESAKAAIAKFLGVEMPAEPQAQAEPPQAAPQAVPQAVVRPPVLCAGCPHRASFYAVKQAVKGQKAVFAGDIGCYTLGNAKPLEMTDTCLCMGADVTIAQGLHRVEPDTIHLSFIGDSTFFASGMTGVVNAVYNNTDITLIVLDNATTAMTGSQPHPGTGVKMTPEIGRKISIEKVLTAIGVTAVEIADPLQLDGAIAAVKRAVALPGVKAVIFRSPCISVSKPGAPFQIDDSCINCKKCIRDIGCPAITLMDGRPYIDQALCYGCGLCAQLCPVHAIKEAE